MLSEELLEGVMHPLCSLLHMLLKGQLHVFAGQVKIVSHSSCRTRAICYIRSHHHDYRNTHSGILKCTCYAQRLLFPHCYSYFEHHQINLAHYLYYPNAPNTYDLSKSIEDYRNIKEFHLEILLSICALENSHGIK